MSSGIVLRYIVETWDSEEAEWECRFKATPGYLYSEKSATKGFLWWKKTIKDWVITNDKQANGRALRRAVRRAEGFLGHDVRILSVTTSGSVSRQTDKVIWANGDFIS